MKSKLKVMEMRECEFKGLIDEYLLGRLSQEETARFEEHYFNCPSCFAETTLRNEIIGVVRQGAAFSHEPAPARAGNGLFTRWAVICASAAAVLLAAWMLIPRPGSVAPQFVLTSDSVVRGASVAVVSPSANLDQAPAYLEWRAAGDGLDYRVTISNDKLLWSAITKGIKIAVPEEIRKSLKGNTTYSWQVKAFDKSGTLVSASAPTAFQIGR